MMMPKFEDIVEFVRDGEADPKMAKQLAQHPDGDELLKQARFVARMLKRRSGSAESSGRVAEAELADMSFEAMSLEASSDGFLQASEAEMRRQPKRSVRDLLRPYQYAVQSLGELTVAIKGKLVALAYMPSEATRDVPGKPPPGFAWGGQEKEGIEVHGSGITLSLPDSVAVGEALPIRLSHGARQMPARGQEVIFMPETGPFVRYEADDDGRLLMPVPAQAGTLRIEAGTTQFLTVKRKK
jgi:hypothetical protein